jgi:hypothetical protein
MRGSNNMAGTNRTMAANNRMAEATATTIARAGDMITVQTTIMMTGMEGMTTAAATITPAVMGIKTTVLL